jgi:hypothetical protein
MATKTRKQLADEINDHCNHSGCSDKIQKIHHAQYVDRHWNPHPPMNFVNWWGSTGAAATEKQTNRAWADIDAVRAFNCEAVREVYREAKSFGV